MKLLLVPTMYDVVSGELRRSICCNGMYGWKNTP
jgi:hypothetical protein